MLSIISIGKNKKKQILLIYFFAAFTIYWTIYVRFFAQRIISNITNYLQIYEKMILIYLILIFLTILFSYLYKIMLHYEYITIKEKSNIIKTVVEKLNKYFVKPIEQFYSDFTAEIYYSFCLPFLRNKQKNKNTYDHILLLKIAEYENFYFEYKNLKRIYIIIFGLPGLFFGIVLNIDIIIYNQFYYSVYFSFLLCIPFIGRFLRYFFESISYITMHDYISNRIIFLNTNTQEEATFNDIIVRIEQAVFEGNSTFLSSLVNLFQLNPKYYELHQEKPIEEFTQEIRDEFIQCCTIFRSSLIISYIQNKTFYGVYFGLVRIILYITALSYRLYFGWS